MLLKMNDAKKNDTKKVNSSIVFKLNTWHLSQVFLSFLWINFIIIALCSALLIFHAETDVARVVNNMDIKEYNTEEQPPGLRLPKMISSIFSDKLRYAVRQVHFENQRGSFWQNVGNMRYRIWVPVSDESLYYAVDYPAGTYILFILPVIAALLLFEFLFLLGSIGKGARAMRSALQPIADLTQTARNINTSQSGQTQLKDLTGTIDNINATQLDTRISVSSAQSELKDLAGAINSMLDRINDSYRSQVRFVSDASHELRTPIAVIQGYVNLLDRWGKNDQEALQESIDAIKSESENMKELVEQLLFLARGDNDSMQLTMEDINLSELAAEIVRETAMIDPAHKFTANTECDVYTVGDAQLIKQALRIFVDNSVKYTPMDGVISVKTDCDDEFAKVVVQDTGFGINPHDLPLVLDRFYRSDDSRARKTGGTGLGLSIAKWIIERHQGRIEILSRKDIGTRITISFVRKAISQTDQAEAGSSESV